MTQITAPHPGLTAARGGAFIVLLILLSGLGQFSTSIYLPSLPAMALSLHTDLASVQFTLTIYLASFALAQLVYGPLADYVGRRPVVLAGLAIFLAGSIAAVLAPTIEILTAGRIAQGIGAAAGVVLSRAIIRDTFEGPRLFAVMGVTTTAFMLVPTCTPLLGGLIEAGLGWRAAFAVSLAAGVAVLTWTLVALPETLRVPSPRLAFSSAAFTYGGILSSGAFLGYALASGFLLGGIFAFMAGSPPVFISTIGASPAEYGIYPPITIFGFFVGVMITRRLAGRWTPAAFIRLGLLSALTAAALIAALFYADLVARLSIAAPMLLYTLGMGLTIPTATGAAIMPFADRAGAASALIGCLQMLAAACGTLAVARAMDVAGPLGLPLTMMAAVLLAGGAFALLAPRQGQDQETRQ